jgi:hypothetical protein
MELIGTPTEPGTTEPGTTKPGTTEHGTTFPECDLARKPSVACLPNFQRFFSLEIWRIFLKLFLDGVF